MQHMPHSGSSCFQFSHLFKFLVQFNLPNFKTIFRFETKLVNKLKYKLYIHVKIIFPNLYIKSLHLNIQIILFFTRVKNYKNKNVKYKII